MNYYQNISGEISSILKDTKKVIQNKTIYRNAISVKKYFLINQNLPQLTQTQSSSSTTTTATPSSYFSFTKYVANSIKRPISTRMHLRPKSRKSPTFNDDASTPFSLYSTRKTSSTNNPMFVTSSKYHSITNSPKERRKTPSTLGRFNNYELFMNEHYKGLHYEEKDIYNNRDKDIINLISNKIEYFMQNENENQTTFFMKDIRSKNLNISLKLSSIKITFNEINDKGEKINKSPFYSFMLPFNLLPIFYYKGIDNFKLILSKILIFSNDYNRLSLNESALYEFLQNQNKIPTNPRELFLNTDDNNNNNKMRLDLSLNPLKLINELSHKKRMFKKSSMNTRKVDADHLSIPSHNVRLIHLYNNTNEYKSNLLSHGYKIVFIWTTPFRQFQVLVETPKVIMIVKDLHLNIEQYIDGYLLFYLYEKLFIHWDFYLLSYLFSFKKCRNIIDAIRSKTCDKTQYENSKFELKNPFLITPVQQYKQTVYDYIATTDKRENTYNYLTAMSLKVILIKYENSWNDYKYEYIIHFNLQQTKKIMKGLSVFPPEKISNYLYKFTEIKDKELKFNYKLFDSMTDKEWMDLLNNILKFSILQKRKSIQHNNMFGLSTTIDNTTNNNKSKHNYNVKYIYADTSVKQLVDVVEPEVVETSLNDEGQLEQIKARSYFELFRNTLAQMYICAWPAKCNVLLKEDEEQKKSYMRIAFKKPQTVHVHNSFRTTFFGPKRSGIKKTMRK